MGKLRDKLWVEVNGASELFVVSPKVVQLFKDLKIDNLEFIDITIIGTGTEIKGYSLINFLGKVDCVDDINSSLSYYTDTAPNYIYSIDGFSINEAKVQSQPPIFLIDRIDDLVILIRDDLQQQIIDRAFQVLFYTT